MQLVCVDSAVCPACGERTGREVLDQPALFVACGYGATLRTVVRHCRCGWSLDAVRGEVRPNG